MCCVKGFVKMILYKETSSRVMVQRDGLCDYLVALARGRLKEMALQESLQGIRLLLLKGTNSWVII